ncbi:dirigent protein 1-like [Phragmites australis]|uniref:dirigent protein 1-like n=1 Tax=Phragmites australis TaxID=29695 RepID=UPI002D797305|nr:dirigent protein 1-like [Phragmites australis]
MACSALRRRSSSLIMQLLPKTNSASATTTACAAALVAIVLQLQLAVVCPAAAGDTHHLHLYMHDGYTGPSPTAVLIVNGTVPVMTGVRFGDTVVMDDVLTEGPSRASRVVGRAQGMYVTASLLRGAPAMLLSANLVLTDYGAYSGSTVAVMGRNDIMQPVRELAVVGGTGRFRMATGYVLWKTATWRGKNAVLELDVFLRA